jgi:hypothetical protein
MQVQDKAQSPAGIIPLEPLTEAVSAAAGAVKAGVSAALGVGQAIAQVSKQKRHFCST